MWYKKFKKQSANSAPLLRVWTMQYAVMLLAAIVIIVLFIGMWVRTNAYEQSFQLLQLRAEQQSETYERLFEENKPFTGLHGIKSIRIPHLVIMQVVGVSGATEMIISKIAVPFELENIPASYKKVLAGKNVREKINVGGQTWLRVGVPIYHNNTVQKALYLSMPAMSTSLQLRRQFSLLGVFSAIIALLGWLVIYFLSRRLTRPLRELAQAARQVAEGEYHPSLPEGPLKEEELQQVVHSFRDMASRLEQLERLRSDLLAGVSHELRTPVTSIRGMIQAVQSGVVADKEADEFLAISLDEAKRLQRMVEDLLEFSSLEAGAAATSAEYKPVNITELISGVIRQLKSLDDFSDIHFQMNANHDEGHQVENEDIWVMGDAGRLRQILMNLLTNSRDAGAEQITINTQINEEKRQIIIDVFDNGKGISEHEKPYIFERFYRGHKDRISGHGLGLGLPLSRLLARAHGGDLLLLHTSSKGTVFRLILPS
ncbi:sensor histidine kinase [Aneurinibacillus terranovensis]|uniref:sensor histidine kinase n=1 Tax=Aneurinibacillus terranovensis TaxID=278991 RepID=UPI0004209E16|nr:HAMP domain-containing sensor histidine kinase [Aneurinibacillus terranovensis]